MGTARGPTQVFLYLPCPSSQHSTHRAHEPWAGSRADASSEAAQRRFGEAPGPWRPLTLSISMWKMRGWGFCCRASRSAWPRELCSCIWAMPQQWRWPSRGSLPAAMLRRLLATSG